MKKLNWYRVRVRNQISKNGQDHWFEPTPRKPLERNPNENTKKEILKLRATKEEIDAIKSKLDAEQERARELAEKAKKVQRVSKHERRRIRNEGKAEAMKKIDSLLKQCTDLGFTFPKFETKSNEQRKNVIQFCEKIIARMS